MIAVQLRWLTITLKPNATLTDVLWGQRDTTYIKDRPSEKTFGIPRTRELRTSHKYPEIPSEGDPKGRLRPFPVLFLATHVRNAVCRKRYGPSHAGQTDGSQLTESH